MHETAYGNSLKKIQHANEKLIELREKITKYDAELKMSSAEAEIAKLSETFDVNLTTDFGEIENVIQQQIDQNRGKVRVAADLSSKGIAEIAGRRAHAGRDGRAGADRLRGRARPEVAGDHAALADGRRTSARPTEKAVRQADAARSSRFHGERTAQTRVLFRGAHRGARPRRPGAVALRRDRPEVDRGPVHLRRAEEAQGRRGGARHLRHHHGQGIQLRRGGQAARGQGDLELQADGGSHRPLRDQRLGRLGPIILANNGFKPGKVWKTPAARSSRSSSC